MTVDNLYQSSIRTEGIMDRAIRFVTENQLKDKDAWRLYIDVFVSHIDTDEGRWRGEYFGKQMRGATLTYVYSKDEELYEILQWACEELLKTQDEGGRFSTYRRDAEFREWDLWCRKYVLTGLLHFCHICKDEELKARILTACQRHLDYIVERIGHGKIEITTTSSRWGCVNSCTILEPTVELYKMTGNECYLEFARYILSTGGSSDCDLIDLALNSDLMPYEYPVVKAYEMMSFYEGVLAYYEVTGEEKYRDAVIRFFELLAKSDITLIGCSGCTHEFFDNSTVRQTEYEENIMQETCVTVTWMRLMARLYFLTQDTKYIDRLEVSGYNALYGSLNTEHCRQYEMYSDVYYPGKIFESYSPLYMNTRGRGIGGFLLFDNGDYGGCCVAIGACGIALMPLTAVISTEEAVYVNHFFQGQVDVKDRDGKDVTLEFDSNYPAEGNCKIKVRCEKESNLCFRIRKPGWCQKMLVNGSEVSVTDSYELSGTFLDGDTITIELQMDLQVHRRNEKVAFTYGALTLACDSAKSERKLEAPVTVTENPTYTLLEPQGEELLRMMCETEDGTLLLTDYQSCGKNWEQENNKITVWLNTKEA